MEVNVKMTAEEFQEFMTYQTDKAIYSKQLVSLHRLPAALACSLSNAVEPVDEKATKFKIIDQEHMGDLWYMAEDLMPKKG